MKMTSKTLKTFFLSLFLCGSVFAAFPISFLPLPQTGEKEGLQLEDLEKMSPFQLDHFKVYRIEPQPANATVFLRGQFENNFVKTALGRYIRFMNPVNKNNEGIIDKHAHLNWFQIFQDVLEPNRKVSLHNQFGLQTIKIGQPVALLAPAEKREPDSQFPQRLDHFKVYEVIQSELVNRSVTLRDQFGSSQNIAISARYFAVPVEKRHNNAYFPIENPQDHIVFYVLEPKELNKFRETKDQFGLHKMTTRYIELLGVPSKKIAWEAGN